MQQKNLQESQPDGIAKIWQPAGPKDFRREYYVDPQPEAESYLPLRVNFVHEEYCYEHYYRRREASEVFSIEMVLEGSMEFGQDDRHYQVGTGSVFLVQLDRNSEFGTGPEKYCRRLACSLAGSILGQLLHSTGLIASDVVTLRDPPRAEALVRQCLNEFKQQLPGFRQRASTLAYELLLELAAALPREKNFSPLVERAVTLMEHHLSQPLALARLAALLGVSPTSLNRDFQHCLHCAPMNYFIILKMNTAKSLLQNTNWQIQEIAARLGYQNPLYFSTEFSKRIGCSPRQFRQLRQQLKP